MNPDTVSVTRWAIIGNCGMYVGQWLYRGDAIKEHCARKFGKRYTPGRAWSLCRKRGDRAVKVCITYLKP